MSLASGRCTLTQPLGICQRALPVHAIIMTAMRRYITNSTTWGAQPPRSWYGTPAEHEFDLAVRCVALSVVGPWSVG
eukprot:COSAG01_NODE_2783_length_7084_cov_242.792269_1_plen_77_part_00